ncbi:uncharacterized protein HMPREF1541_08483 [Cyphellophora europaea CBS 101466]|uniref:Zn(2)-C6 fungal-type domain-containing protein n=1 Tax=Cyphellophora europaea (strain CBS 101466) TaxID=1220924 RepID=W2RI89_CYPE1|nr:uncharacterized protein HMPREF1541_08483 [Cyphellophora europaea CBS 101466]ETN36206.1 hypothetical protein HMPREF1541_08483 [Cyphellophora europaea CBS 101466]
MHVEAKNRKRRKAPKVRTGCLACKQARIKCDEAKPDCLRCKNSGRDCKYDPVRIWTFEPSAVSASKVIIPSAKPSPVRPLQWFPPEERQALQHYERRTGPWIANYAPPEMRKLWEVTIPRCAQALPATRHVMVAVALLDEPTPHPDTSKLLARSQRVLYHYNRAIRHLTGSVAPSKLDMTLTSVLSWLLEVLGFNSGTAKMHIAAADKLAHEYRDPRLCRLASSKTETDDIMQIDIPALIDFCQSYLTTTPAAGNRSTPDELNTETSANPVLAALLLRQGLCPISKAEEFKEAWETYFTTLQPLMPGGMTVAEADDFIAYWKVAVLRFRYIATVPSIIVLLGYLIGALARCLLPSRNSNEPYSINCGAVDFILARATDMTVMQMEPDHSRMLEEMLCLTATTVMRFVPNHEQWLKARAVWDACERQIDFYALSKRDGYLDDLENSNNDASVA